MTIIDRAIAWLRRLKPGRLDDDDFRDEIRAHLAIAAYDQDAWAAAGRYTARDPLKSLELFRVVREANLALLESLAPEQWHDYGVHSERGRESIEHLVRMSAGHDVNHMWQIERILARA